MTTGERIKELRTARHMTQEELAKRAHVTKQAVSLWESDKSALSLTSSQMLCDIFNVNMDYLMGRLPMTTRFVSTEEMYLLDAYRQLSREEQAMVCRMLGISMYEE